MKINMKKILSIFIIIAMLLVEYPFLNTVQAATSSVYPNKDSWYENSKIFEFYSDSHTTDYNNDKVSMAKLPSGQPMPRYITKNGNKYYLNHKIYVQKNLYVYGSYASVAANYFKCGYQVHVNLGDLQPTLFYGNGYFKKGSSVPCKGWEQNPEDHGDSCEKHVDGTIRGEWKFLGFDVNGNDFSNMWMINVATVTTFKERNWIMEPWSSSNEVKKRLVDPISTFNQAAYNTIGNYPKALAQGTKDWIYKTFKDSFNGNEFKGIPLSGKTYDPNVYKYLYVQSPPTLKQSGSGKMWHVKPSGATWYQTFSIPVIKTKTTLPVNCTVSAAAPIPKLPTGSEADDKKVTLEFKVQGELLDNVIRPEDAPAPTGWTGYYNDDVATRSFYTRQDISEWSLKIDKIAGLTLTTEDTKAKTANPKSKLDNKGSATFKIDTTVGKLKGLEKRGDSFVIKVDATATVKYSNALNSSDDGKNEFLTGVIPPPPEPDDPPAIIDIPTLEVQNHIGEIAYDGVPFFDATDSTDMSLVTSTELYINGQEIDFDTFFKGQYIFPATTDKNGYFAEVICKYNLDKSKIPVIELTDEQKALLISPIPVQYVSTDYVYVYPTKPNAQYKLTSNTWKQNRIINVENNTLEGNIQLVINKYPITEYRWSYGGDTSKLNYGTNTDMIKQLQYKEAGSYSLTLECKNSLGKWSDPYTVEYQVFEDYAPNIEVNLSDSVLTRNDELSAWHYDTNSTDGDKVANAKIELWYDTDNNGSVDSKVQEWNGLGDNGICEMDDFPKYTPTKLGYYKYKLFAKDEFVGIAGQDTLSQYVTDTDKKENTYEVELWVDNYQPLSDVYIDVAIERPNVDLYIMGDKGLPDEKLYYLSDNRVAIENTLLGKNILPSVNIWNMKTYEYSTPASTSSNTGTSYPSGSVPYSSAGYSGTLPRTSVSDNGGYHDFGHTETRTESKTVSVGGASVSGTGTSNNFPPSSYSYSSDGYTGSLSPYGYVYWGETRDGVYYWSRTYSGYSGTVSKQVSYWVPDVRWVANYTGYYSGTIYKYVRQPYVNPWRAESSKYILYISDGTISELADFNSTVAKADAKIILAGTSNIQSQSALCAKYIDVTGKTTQEIVNEALEFISKETPSIEQVYVLPNQTFTLNYGEDDLENDTIISREMQYVHDKDYFDNPTGQEPSTQATFSDTSGWNTLNRSSFGNVGKYQIYRRVKDLPTGAYGDDYSYYSGATEVNIYVHRKPIADAVLDWTYDTSTSVCKTIWVDKSYDLDHNITRASTDKGIVEKKIMFRKDGGEWLYYIPSTLTYGTYDVQYYVKDMEGVWSDPWTFSFILNSSPQFTASVRARDTEFSLSSIPASEYLEAYNLWTRQASPVRLEMNLTPNVSGLPATKTVNYQKDVTGTQTGQDIDWFNQTLQIPDVFPDGLRTFTILARDNATGIATPKSFSVNVFTPINLQPNLGGRTINTNIQATIGATTTKYPSTTSVIMQYGSAYQSASLSMAGTTQGSSKGWTLNYTPPNNVVDGTYTARFTSTNPSGKQEIKDVIYQVIRNRPPVVSIKSVTPEVIYEGDDVGMVFEVTDPDQDQVLTSKVVVKKGTATIYTNENISNISNGEKKTFSMNIPKLTDVGSYTISITTTDQYLLSDTATTTFTVNGLSIDGYVDHTATWKSNWIKYNQHLTQNGKSTLGSDTFFTGEKYVLSADTTNIASGSDITALNVIVKLTERTYSSVGLSKQSTNTFKGEMWNEDMRGTRWRGTIATFLFSVTYSNGTIKTDSVRTYIVDDDYWRIKMAF